jgi:ubiquinone/menaquinone biosynthesis C-methylase UbiE
VEVLNDIADVEQLDNRSRSNTSFERSYLSLRLKEQRIYTDEQLASLPEVPKNHLYHHEWHIRAQSAKKLINYLKKKKKPLRILEIGCGNAWLSAKIAQETKAEITGIDPNREEVMQGKRVFKKSNLMLEVLDFETENLGDEKFNIILFAASVQYFPSMQKILTKTKQYLSENGEIHLIDSNFYNLLTVMEAKKRTQVYFSKMGFPEMALFYFHHQLDQLKDFNYEILYNPKSPLNRLLVKNPFYWICIK